jgi:hypothetical protein
MSGAPTLGGEQRSADEIRQDIDQTRVQMDHTLTAMQQSLSTRGLLDQVRDVVQDASKRARILRMLRVSPGVAAVAAASLVGAGASIAFLVAQGADEEMLRRKKAKKYVEHPPGLTPAGEVVETTHAVRGGLGDRITHRLRQWKDRIISSAKRGGEGGQTPFLPRPHPGEQVRGKAPAAEGPFLKAGEAAHRALGRAQEHPLAAAGAGVAAGVLLGVLLPTWPNHHETARRARKEARLARKECFEKAEQLTAAPPDDAAQAEGQPPGMHETTAKEE